MTWPTCSGHSTTLISCNSSFTRGSSSNDRHDLASLMLPTLMAQAVPDEDVALMGERQALVHQRNLLGEQPSLLEILDAALEIAESAPMPDDDETIRSPPRSSRSAGKRKRDDCDKQ